jgi:murein DD-endopeptidase MepM/ murein hydrolase activator NlpD
MAIQTKLTSRFVTVISLFAVLLPLNALADKVQAAETFSVNGNKALNTNYGFRRFDGEPRMSIFQRNDNDPDQQFDRLSGNLGGTLLKHRTTGKCLNAHYLSNGAEINVWGCNGSDPDQNWNMLHQGNGVNLIQRRGTNLCVDSPTRNDVGKVHLWTCDANNANQRFQSSQGIALPPPSGNVALPFGRNQTWYVCQGYNGSVSHQNYYALDLTVAQDFGSNNACWAADSNVNKSARREILAPANGTVWHVNSDLVCLSLDNGRSLLIGHMDRNVTNGQRVTKDALLGRLSVGNSANGGYSHIHLEGRNSPACKSGTSVPLTAQYGLQLEGVGDLPGDQTHWKKALLRP